MRLYMNPGPLGPAVVVLGMFDGVHRGHQALLLEGDRLASARGLPLAVCTFEPHPMAVLRPDICPPRLTTLTERAALMAGFGVEQLCVYPFTRALADQPPADFLAWLLQALRPAAWVCGFNYTFGRAGSGSGDLLRDFGAAHGIETSVVPDVRLRGETVSSTRIRALLEAGDISQATALLGHAWTLTGRIGAAEELRLSADKALPGAGVYCCWLEDGRRARPALARVAEGAVYPRALAGSQPRPGSRVRLRFLRRLCGPESSPDEAAAMAFFAGLMDGLPG